MISPMTFGVPNALTLFAKETEEIHKEVLGPSWISVREQVKIGICPVWNKSMLNGIYIILLH
jgi:hypothetical protein